MRAFLQGKGQVPPDLAWHTAVVLPRHECMLVYGGAIMTEQANGTYECRTANWDTFAYYLKENRWARMPRQKTTPGEKLPSLLVCRLLTQDDIDYMSSSGLKNCPVPD